jgi:hypothetical protein
VKAPRRRRGEVGSKPTLGTNQMTDDGSQTTDRRHVPNPSSVLRPLSSDPGFDAPKLHHGVSAGAQARLASKPAGVRLPVTPPFFRSKPSKVHGAAC